MTWGIKYLLSDKETSYPVRENGSDISLNLQVEQENSPADHSSPDENEHSIHVHDNHRHEIAALTGPAIVVSIPADKHVHFVEPVTTINKGHYHHLLFATLINTSPA